MIIHFEVKFLKAGMKESTMMTYLKMKVKIVIINCKMKILVKIVASKKHNMN